MSPTLCGLLPGGPGRALVDGAAAWTHDELRAAAAAVARRLVAAGAGPGTTVGLLAGRSGAAVVAVHGILAAGATVLPLDPMDAPLRLATILEDAGAAAVLVGTVPPARLAALRRAAPELPPLLPLVPPAAPASAAAGPPAALPVPAPDDLALVLYTSGSTGRPKGVELSHGAVAAFATWAVGALGLGPADVVAHLSPLGFDLSTLELFAAAAAGATTWVAPPALTAAPAALRAGLEDAGVTVLYTVPSVWQRLAGALPEGPGGLPALRWALTAGEAYPPAALGALMARLPQAQVANLFGPTESNVCCWQRLSGPPAGPVPIGGPAAGARLMVVEGPEDGPPDGVLGDASAPAFAVVEGPGTGELWVQGPALMRGYRGHPAATARAFATGPEGGRWLRTGDRVRRDAAGRLHFCGRRDRQLKRRGFRIQPEEVEAACAALPGVAAARVDWTGRALVAALEADPGAPADLRAAWRALRQRLPAALLPDELCFVEALPRTARGKLRRPGAARPPG